MSVSAKQDADPLHDDAGRLLCGADKRNGTRCRRRAGWGTLTPGYGPCKNHGGSTRNHQLRAAGAKARAELAVMGAPIPIHPIQAILQCVAIAYGEVEYATQRIYELAPNEAVAALLTAKTRPLKGEYGAETGEMVDELTKAPPEIHIWVRVRWQSMDRVTHYGNIALRADVAERFLTIAEQQGRMFAGAVRRILVRCGVNPDDPNVREVVRSELAALTAGSGALPALPA